MNELKETQTNPEVMTLKYRQPPQTCRLTVYGCALEDGTEILPSHNLEWRGEVNIRYCPDKDNLMKLYAGKSHLWCEVSCIELLGRPDKSFSLSEAAKRGELLDIIRRMRDEA